MKNLEQLRAAHALARSAALDKRVLNKMPALILSNGLLAAAAFSLDSESRREMCEAMDAIADHLSRRGHLAKLTGADSQERVRSMISELASNDSSDLQRATTEALCYLGFLKRFAVKGAEAEE